MSRIEIREFCPEDQADIDVFMRAIAAEFREPITMKSGKSITEVAREPGQYYWVAVHAGRVVGTVGITKLADRQAVLKRMFVAADFRGKEKRTAALLLQHALNEARAHDVHKVFLGTMGQFVAAQRFYVAHQFVPIELAQLPADFPRNPLDSLFYARTL